MGHLDHRLARQELVRRLPASAGPELVGKAVKFGWRGAPTDGAERPAPDCRARTPRHIVGRCAGAQRRAAGSVYHHFTGGKDEMMAAAMTYTATEGRAVLKGFGWLKRRWSRHRLRGHVAPTHQERRLRCRLFGCWSDRHGRVGRLAIRGGDGLCHLGCGPEAAAASSTPASTSSCFRSAAQMAKTEQ